MIVPKRLSHVGQESIYFSDPDGNIIELYWERPDARDLRTRARRPGRTAGLHARLRRSAIARQRRRDFPDRASLDPSCPSRRRVLAAATIAGCVDAPAARTI
jgi:hypothetical protein